MPGRLLLPLAAVLAASALGLAAAEPYVQEESYLLLPGCCTFGFEAGDTTLRLVFHDASGALGLALGARAEVHDPSHGPLRTLHFCADSGEVALPEGSDHVHVYPYDAAQNAASCGPLTGLTPTVGRLEARMNGA